MDELEYLKLEALKELAYGASHEINNPLANIAARAQTLLRDEPHPERRRALEAIHQQALRAHEMISDLMLFARPPKLQLATVDLAALLSDFVAHQREVLVERNVTLDFTACTTAILVQADAQQLEVAISAIFRNAVEAIGRDGTIRVSLARNGDTACLTVADNGPGLSDHVRAHMFEPFFSGREAGRGLGFGLSKAWRIITDHGGRIVVGSAPNAGTEVCLLLPQAS